MRTPHTPKPESAKQVQCWFDPEVLGRLDEEAKRLERSRSYVVGKAVEQYLRRTNRDRGTPKRSEERASMDVPQIRDRVVLQGEAKDKPANRKTGEEVPAPAYNPLIDFIEAKDLARALKPAKKGK